MPLGSGPLLISARANGGGPFSPYDEPGMLAWWNSSNTNLDGGFNVISYLDVSGNGQTASAASAPQRPTTTFGDPDYGGNPSNGWSNVNDTLVTTDGVLLLGAYTVVQVCKIPSSVSAYMMSMSAGDYVFGNTGLSLYTVARGGGAGASGYDADAGAGWFDFPTPRVYVRRMDGTHVGDQIWANDVQIPMHSSFFTDDPGVGPINVNFAMMAYILGGAAVDGSWTSTIVYDHAVSNLVKTKLTNYFRTLYSI